MNASNRLLPRIFILAAFICVYGFAALTTSLWFLPASLGAQKKSKEAKPANGLSAELDAIIEKAIADDEIPGAVVLVSHHGQIILRKAYGSRAVLPTKEPMTVDTIFDLASLTKVFATAQSVMKLVERGKVALNDPVAKYIPEFAAGKQEGKDQVTIRHLLTHMAGLAPIPRNIAAPGGSEQVLAAIYNDVLVAPSGMRFLYSDSGFILLAELVRRVSGMPLDEFAAKELYTPLGMKHTRFRPPEEWLPKIAPTEEIDLPEGAKAGSGKGHVLRGVVHDPRARSMGGAAGHAGLFSGADDLAIFCRMLLERGKGPRGPRFFADETIRKMVTPQTPPWSPTLRGLGWDIDSTYSSPRGNLFPLGSFGHTGFTGTSVWMDGWSQTIVILLTNSVHPYGRPPISSLRSRVATQAANVVGWKDEVLQGAMEALGPPNKSKDIEIARAMMAGLRWPYPIDLSVAAGRAPQRNAHTKTGLDVLEEQNFEPLRGKRVGLITNHTGLDRDGKSTIDLLAHAEGVKLVALFSPEHGIAGRAEDKVVSSTDAATGLPIYSLYGETRRPTEEMLRGIDTLVFDIQDAGVRFYTYITTMGYAMEEAAKRHISFYVLDRPDPLGGEAIEGPMLDRDRLSFIGYFPMPVRMGMTLGEMAQMFNAENKIGCDLHVITMKDWRRHDWYEATGLPWVAPSPNLRSLNAALLYPGIEILQDGDVAVGRGTDTPFELFGAPWIKATELADYLNHRFVPGVRFVPMRFTPRAGPHKDKLCEGIALVITDRASLHSMLMGLEIAAALWKLYPNDFKLDKIISLVGSAATIARLKKGDAPPVIVADWVDDLEGFKKVRAKYLLYP